jgi:hypothetical protein
LRETTDGLRLPLQPTTPSGGALLTFAHCRDFKARRLDRDGVPEGEKRYARQATPCFERGCATKRRSADVDSVQMILSAKTERTGASGGAIEEVASWYTESGRLQA